MHLVGKKVVLRPGEPQDVARLTAIANEPDVAARWGPTDEADVAARFVNTETSFIVSFERDVIGAIQYEEESDPMYRRAGIDIFITASSQGLGFATDSIRTLARYLFEERGHHRLTIDPAADNERAIRAYEAVGFRRVGVMRAYERGVDGSWHDGLLMDLLVGDLSFHQGG
jgi:aminoglycoside 6'-N-acetyltransferase